MKNIFSNIMILITVGLIAFLTFVFIIELPRYLDGSREYVSREEIVIISLFLLYLILVFIALWRRLKQQARIKDLENQLKEQGGKEPQKGGKK